MGIIELNRDLLGQIIPISVVSLKAAHEIGQRTRNQKIFLDETQALAHSRGVVRIEHARERFRFQRLAQCTNEVTCPELLKIKEIRRSRRPEPKRINRLSSIAHHRTIKGYPDQAGRTATDDLKTTPTQLKGAVQLHFHLFMRSSNLPGIGVAEPIVRVLLLPAIHDGLLEHAVFVTQTIACRRKLHGSHRVQETGRETAKASVAKARVRFLVD